MVNEMIQGENGKLDWIIGPPKEPGIYWFRFFYPYGWRTQCVSVSLVRDDYSLPMEYHFHETERILKSVDAADHYHWPEPLVAPPPPPDTPEFRHAAESA